MKRKFGFVVATLVMALLGAIGTMPARAGYWHITCELSGQNHAAWDSTNYSYPYPSYEVDWPVTTNGRIGYLLGAKSIFSQMIPTN